jgi:hypothetical protein
MRAKHNPISMTKIRIENVILIFMQRSLSFESKNTSFLQRCNIGADFTLHECEKAKRNSIEILSECKKRDFILHSSEENDSSSSVIVAACGGSKRMHNCCICAKLFYIHTRTLLVFAASNITFAKFNDVLENE